jgi:hypothetical protein
MISPLGSPDQQDHDDSDRPDPGAGEPLFGLAGFLYLFFHRHLGQKLNKSNILGKENHCHLIIHCV